MQTNDWRYYARLMAGVALVSIAGPVIGVGAAILLGVQNAYPHEALPTAAQPQGWSYPFSCCSGYDCREVTFGPDGMVREDAARDGYVIATTDEFIPQSDTRIKDSPDGQFHWCSVAGKNDSKTICLFVPPKAF